MGGGIPRASHIAGTPNALRTNLFARELVLRHLRERVNEVRTRCNAAIVANDREAFDLAINEWAAIMEEVVYIDERRAA